MRTSLVLALAMGALSAVAAEAGVIFSAGNITQTDEPVLFHDSCVGCVDGPALLVIGHEQFSNILVDLTSQTQLIAADPGHNTVSTDAGFSALNVAVPGYIFTSIILQLTSLPTAADGTVTFTAHTTAGDFVSSTLFDGHTGGNYYTVTTTLGTEITSLDLATTQPQHDISQIRIGGTAPAVPEPGTLLLTGAGLIGAGLFGRRRTRGVAPR